MCISQKAYYCTLEKIVQKVTIYWLSPLLNFILCSKKCQNQSTKFNFFIGIRYFTSFSFYLQVVIREERGSSPHALGDVLEEVRREVEELTEELKGRQDLEAAVQGMQVKVEQGLTALRQMSTELGTLKNEQKRMWREVSQFFEWP